MYHRALGGSTGSEQEAGDGGGDVARGPWADVCDDLQQDPLQPLAGWWHRGRGGGFLEKHDCVIEIFRGNIVKICSL